MTVRELAQPARRGRLPAGWPDRAVAIAGLARVQAVIDHIAVGVDELARARRAGRRRRLAGPDLEFRAFCTRKGLPVSSTRQLQRAWGAGQAGQYQRGETGQRPGYTGNPFRPR